MPGHAGDRGAAQELSRFGGAIAVGRRAGAAFSERTRQQVFEELDRELREVDVLRVVDSQWLVGDLRRDFDNVMDLFRARGGRVQDQSQTRRNVASDRRRLRHSDTDAEGGGV